MVHRRFWLKLLERAWKERSVVWLAGVRRVGKTCLCQDLSEVEYFDCELPRVRRMMLDPESFLDGLVGKRVVLDEVHRLQNPSELLKNCSRPSSTHTHCGDWFFDSGGFEKIQRHVDGPEEGPLAGADVSSRQQPRRRFFPRAGYFKTVAPELMKDAA